MENDVENEIHITGASQNNLKSINVDIPKGKIVAFVGVSGSGKSSLVFDTIAAESNRQWQASYPFYLRNKMPHYERPDADRITGLTPAIVVDQKPIGAGARSTVATAVDVAPLLRLLFSRVGEPSAGGSMAYSPNHPMGMCPHCSGLGMETVLDENSLFDMNKTVADGGILFSQFSSGWQTYIYQRSSLFPADKPLRDFTPEEWNLLKYGRLGLEKIPLPSGNTGKVDMVEYEGVVPRFTRLYIKRDISKLKKSLQEEILTHVHSAPCQSCSGTGLNPAALCSKIHGKNIFECLQMNAAELLKFLSTLTDPKGISLAGQITGYLSRMEKVGLGYLTLDRRTDTLSGGEAQRLKIVRNLGSALSDVTYIFDEPTAGLHPADAERIGKLLIDLKNRHNNVLMVEHKPQMMAIADHIIELGPGAGENGGEVVYEGDLCGLRKSDTGTGKMLRRKIEISPHPLPWEKYIEIKDAHCHNLKHIDVNIPKGVLTAITGVAGSGKSSLAIHELGSRCPEAIVISQKPIGISIRSTPATYTGVMDTIRELFARENEVGAEWFSSNSKGACPACKGKGEISYEMAFAEPVKVICEECGGHRYNPTAMSYRYKGKNIEEVMALTIEQAIDFFSDEKIKRPLQSLMNVGLGYMTLGQPTSTLSGGETQRVKLASELHKSGNIYILDEPTTGLHGNDAEKLLTLLRHIVALHNTVVIVEHRLEMIAGADWVIDMGPGGGEDGGNMVYSGIPEGLLRCDKSITGKYLQQAL